MGSEMVLETSFNPFSEIKRPNPDSEDSIIEVKKKKIDRISQQTSFYKPFYSKIKNGSRFILSKQKKIKMTSGKCPEYLREI